MYHCNCYAGLVIKLSDEWQPKFSFDFILVSCNSIQFVRVNYMVLFVKKQYDKLGLLESIRLEISYLLRNLPNPVINHF